MLGVGIARIIAVDPQDPNVVLLRLISTNGEAIALTRDGGATFTRTQEITGTFTSYVELPNGTRLVGAMVDSNTTPALFRSRDGGATFETVPNAPRIRALSQRGGVVYAATDNFGDGYALGASDDDGTTWRKVMSYDQIQAIVPCLRQDAQCQATCQALAGQGAMSPGMIWEANVCSADPKPQPPPKMDGGCGCATGGPVTRSVLVLVAVLVFVLRRNGQRATGNGQRRIRIRNCPLPVARCPFVPGTERGDVAVQGRVNASKIATAVPPPCAVAPPGT
jgi:MYXO-CTERM domain-containing protein